MAKFLLFSLLMNAWSRITLYSSGSQFFCAMVYFKRSQISVASFHKNFDVIITMPLG